MRVKDRYLGILRYVFLLATFVYIVGYVLVYEKGYLKREKPVGTVVTSLKTPRGKPINPSDYPYCVENGSTTYRDPRPCMVWDDVQALYPPEELNSMSITTRVTNTTEEYFCDDTSVPCVDPWRNTTFPNEFYLAGVETFSVRVSHSMQAPNFYRASGGSLEYGGTSDQMSGSLVDTRGRVLKSFSNEQMDTMPLSLILEAADVDLNNLANVNETQRHAGTVLLFFITYSSDGTGAATYKYTVSQVRGSQTKVVEAMYEGGGFRQTIDRHGVKLAFIQGGLLGRFDFQTMLVQLVSALGLLSVATVVVELLMLYVLPHKKHYSKYKYQETVDFSDVRDAERTGSVFEVGGQDGGGMDHPLLDPEALQAAKAEDIEFRRRLQSDLGSMRGHAPAPRAEYGSTG